MNFLRTTLAALAIFSSIAVKKGGSSSNSRAGDEAFDCDSGHDQGMPRSS